VKNETEVITIKNILFLLLLIVPVVSSAEEQSKESMIVVNTKIPADYKKMEAGKSLLTQVEIILIKEEYNDNITDVQIEYKITDSRGNILMHIAETKGIIDRLFTVKELMLPSDVLPGVYTLTVKASYLGKKGTETASFEVLREKQPLPFSFTEKEETILLGILSLLFMGFFVALYHEHRKIKRLEREGYRRI